MTEVILFILIGIIGINMFFLGKYVIQLRLLKAALWGVFEEDLKEDMEKIQTSLEAPSYELLKYDDYDGKFNDAIYPLQNKLKKLIDEKIPKPYDSTEIRNILARYLWDKIMIKMASRPNKK